MQIYENYQEIDKKYLQMLHLAGTPDYMIPGFLQNSTVPDSSSEGEGGGVLSRSCSEPSLLVRFRFFLENCNRVLKSRRISILN